MVWLPFSSDAGRIVKDLHDTKGKQRSLESFLKGKYGVESCSQTLLAAVYSRTCLGIHDAAQSLIRSGSDRLQGIFDALGRDLSSLLFHLCQVIRGLHAQPGFGAASERLLQADCHFG